jgi:hypothetical protein
MEESMTSDDYSPQRSYQDDFDDGPDPIMNERDDPTRELGIPANEFAVELDRMDQGEDARERIEDLDEDSDQEGKTI